MHATKTVTETIIGKQLLQSKNGCGKWHCIACGFGYDGFQRKKTLAQLLQTSTI